MYYVYLLDSDAGMYIGQTADIEKRIHAHTSGYVKSTAKLGAVVCRWWWNVCTRYEALKLELYLQRMQREHGDSSVWGLMLDSVTSSQLLREALKLPDTQYQRQFKYW